MSVGRLTTGPTVIDSASIVIDRDTPAGVVNVLPGQGGEFWCTLDL